jgi:hypothetical protein
MSEQAQNNDHESQLNEIYQKLQDGDISVPEAIKQSNELTAEITAREVLSGVNKHTEELTGEKDFKTAEKKFLDDHPDYEELVASGKLQPFIDANPMLVDETLAYFQYKAQAAHDEGFEKGKAGKQPVSESGNRSFRRTPKRMEKPLNLSESEMFDRQMKIVGRMRGEI